MNNRQKASGTQSQKSLWPAYFPYPSSWLKSFALALWMTTVLKIAGFWGFHFGIALSNITEHPEPLLWSLGLTLLAPVLLFSYLHHFLWGKPFRKWPRWLPNPKILWSGLFASIVMSLAIAVSVFCVMPFHDLQTYNQTTIETEAKWFGAIWLITAAYLYQLKYLIRQSFISKSKTH